ncbi:hypothetical protein DEO72_LG5g738 [Vigna unguiculata]|uniref:TF-B3 domain-containing protein n=1 Tax=Vigna unguiculata TaxID=3917 RepID=A0A4D6LW46_VIGUN|nr:hypothetical protein DEO72_LG5g738 [Vigna unguiculata]
MRIEADEPLFNGPKLHFFIFLNPNQCNASHLDLPGDFSNYLRQGRFKYIYLYGPRKTVKCKLLLRNHPKKSSKIGSGWKEFCTAHGFHQTIDLVFEVDHMKSNQNVKQNDCKNARLRRKLVLQQRFNARSNQHSFEQQITSQSATSTLTYNSPFVKEIMDKIITIPVQVADQRL